MNSYFLNRTVLSLLVLSYFSPALMAKYIIINSNHKQKCLSDFCTHSQSIEDQLIESFSVKKMTKKSQDEGGQFKIEINQSMATVSILDQQTTDGFIPLMKVTGTHQMDLNLYAIYATSGTAGRYYHYFQINDKKTRYLGFMPELSVDNDGHFISREADGHKMIITTWQWKKNKFKLIKQEVLR